MISQFQISILNYNYVVIFRLFVCICTYICNMNKLKKVPFLIDLAYILSRIKSNTPFKFSRPLYFINQSKFYRPQISVEQLLIQNQIDFNDSASNVFRLKYCPFCKKPHKEDPTNLYTLNVNKQSGLYYCHRCSSGGSYLNLKKALLGIKIDPIASDFTPTPRQIEQQILSETEYFIYKQNMKKEQFKDVIQYLNSRGLSNQTIEKYSIGCGHQIFINSEGQSISVKVMYFPMHKLLSQEQQKKKLLQLAESDTKLLDPITQLTKIKLRGIGKQNKKYMRQYPAGPARGLFGLNTIKKSDKKIVLTEGQLDAMSVYQITGIPSLSLPQGANSLPDTILPYLDQFQEIVLWMDNDEAGKLNIQKFSIKLGVSRTKIVTHNFKQLKDANDFLQHNPKVIEELIRKARSVPDQNILLFEQFREKVKERIMDQNLFKGIQLSDFKYFNKKVKGIRTAQVSVISGGTGSGKTTLLSQISIDLAQKKIPILWGSFEIRNQILITNMMYQYSQINMKKNKNAFDQIADQFTDLPLYYMSFHGSNQVNKVLGTITYAIEKYGVTFIVVDTLQFLLSGQAQGYKKFDMQDYTMSEFRKIATTYNVHIAVVIHPRKTEQNQDIGIHSIYGTSKATQQADNIWVIQNRNGYKILDIKKNRYDGDVGRVAIGFNKDTKSFFELKKRELESLFSQQKTIRDILEDRQAQKEEKDKQFGEAQSWLDLEEMSKGDQPELARPNYKKKY